MTADRQVLSGFVPAGLHFISQANSMSWAMGTDEQRDPHCLPKLVCLHCLSWYGGCVGSEMIRDSRHPSPSMAYLLYAHPSGPILCHTWAPLLKGKEMLNCFIVAQEICSKNRDIGYRYQSSLNTTW